MQPYLITSPRGTQVRTKTGTPSSSSGIVAGTTSGKPVLVVRQSGARAAYLTRELDMETTSITTTSTELHTVDNKMIDFSQVVSSVFSSDITGSAEELCQNQPGISKTAIFDVQSEPSMDSRRVLPFKHNESLSLPTYADSSLNNGYSAERPMLSMSPHVSSMVDSLLSSERPISPSDFLQKNETPSQPQMQDEDIPQHLLDEIDELLADIPIGISGDCTQQLDLNLFNSQFPEPADALNNIVHECGILDEMESHGHPEGSIANITMEEKNNVHQQGDKLNFKVEENLVNMQGSIPALNMEDSDVFCEGEVFNPMTQPSKIQSNCVGPIRTRQTRRDRRKPARYRTTNLLENEPVPAKVTEEADLEDFVASPSSTSSSRRNNKDNKELSNEEKYIRNREQNNLASKRCREKRKKNLETMTKDLEELKTRNKYLLDKVAQLTQLRDDFKDFVNKSLFQRIAHKQC